MLCLLFNGIVCGRVNIVILLLYKCVNGCVVFAYKSLFVRLKENIGF